MMKPLSANQLLAMFEYCPFPVLIRDKNGRVAAYNTALEKLLGIDATQNLTRLDPLTSSEHPAHVLLNDGSLIIWTDNDAREHYFETHDMVLAGNDQMQVRFFVDVSQRVSLEHANTKLNHELRQHILTDSVTGLLNRRGVELALEPQVARSRRYNSPISVIVLQVNNEENRDELLIEITRLLKDQLRWADLVGCSEQYEFILVLPETTAKAALKLADKLKIQLDQLAERISENHTIPSCCGITDWRKNDNALTLLKRAEVALQKASLQQSCFSIAL